MNDWLFSKKNFVLFGICAAMLVVGYLFLAESGPEGSTAEHPLSKSAAPAILVVVYCGLIPFSIMYGYGKDGGKKDVGK